MKVKKIVLSMLVGTIMVLGMPLEAFANQQTFNDVPVSHMFYSSVEDMASKDITDGCRDNEYCPDDLITRAQMATFLVRAFQLPESSWDYFSDDTGSIHEADINSLAAAGIVSGCDVGNFCPHGAVTREVITVILVGVIGLESSGVDYFWDDEYSPFENAINTLAHYGLTTGCGNSNFCPGESVTRGEITAFLARALDLGTDPQPNPRIQPRAELPPGGTPELNRELGKFLAAKRGWTGEQWTCLDNIVQRESNWKHTAQNPTSTAYGIFQFLNSTWDLVGAQKTSDPAGQIEAGLDYIGNRYGSPCGAWSFWQKNHWY